MKKTLLTIMALVLFSATSIFSQTTLSAGDIAFVGINSDGDDDFAFVLLKDITSSTILHITDKGWNGISFADNAEGILTWTATSNLAAGTVIHIKTTDGGVMSTGSFVASLGSLAPKSFPWDFNLSYTGDQLFIFQGTEVSPTFVTGIHYNVVDGVTNTSNWDGSASSNQTSCLPSQLENGISAIWVHASGLESDNFAYNGLALTGYPATIRAKLNNVANWSADGTVTNTLNPFPITFNVLTPCAEADIPTITANPTSICAGSTTTLSISGSLNDATEWKIYSGSCGGTLVGSTSSASYVASPGSSMTYYIRGEGGCTTPGSCGTTSVTVKNPTSISSHPAASSTPCEGETAIVLSITASGTGPIGYQWYNSFGSISGANNSTYNVTTSISNSDTYYCIATGDCGSKSSNDAIVKINPKYFQTETKTICSGESYTFPDGTTQNNITAQMIHTSNLQTVGTLCDSIIETTVNVNPVYNLTETKAVCSGGSYTFPDGTTQNNITDQVIHTSNLKTVGTLCDSIIVTTINVIIVDVSVTQDLETLTANAMSAEYQWLDCNDSYAVISGETNQSFTASLNGSYAVEIIENGCADTSICTSIISTGVFENSILNNISIFPNPTNGIINIIFESEYSEIKLTVSDITGRTIEENNYVRTKDISFNLEDKPSGIYIFEVSTKEEKKVFKIIKE